MSSRDDVAELVRSIEENERREASPSRDERGRRTHPVWLIVLALAVVGSAYAWLLRPAWLVGDAGASVSQVDEEGRLRYRMYVLASRIESFRRSNGELPDGLDQVGVPADGIQYERTGPDSWMLSGESGEARATYRSSDPMESFLQGD